MGDNESFVDRLEAINKQRHALDDEKRRVYAEARAAGHSVEQIKVEVEARWKAMSEPPAVRGCTIDRPVGMAESRQAYRAGVIIGQDIRYRDAIVYFVHFPELRRLKIGITTNLDQRIADLSAGNGAKPILLGAIEGNRQSEITAHEAFAKYLIAGEWFRYTHDCAVAVAEYLTRARAQAA